MSAPPPVSVLMTVYNGERFLQAAIDSILGQSFADFEFVIIDDGSTDNTSHILASCRDSRVKVIAQENQGLVRALNRGLEIVRGPWVARMDADDISMPDRLAAQERLVRSDPRIVLAGTAIIRIDENGRARGLDYYLANDSELREDLLIRNPFAHGSVIMSREHVQAAGGYRAEYWPAEDYDLWGRLASAGRLANSLEPLYRYRENPQGTSAVHDPGQREMAARISDELLAKWPAGNGPHLKALIEPYRSAPPAARQDCIDRIVANSYHIAMALARRGKNAEAARRCFEVAFSGTSVFRLAARKLSRSAGA